MRIDTWVNNELITIDTENVWAETFAQWDTLVATDTAAAIATATVKALEQAEDDAITEAAMRGADLLAGPWRDS